MKLHQKIVAALGSWLLALGSINAQVNLVLNGNFEIYSQCPAWGIGNGLQPMYATGWFVSGGTPDYWNACSNGVPYAEVGYQQDCCGGKGYVGMYVIVSINTPGDDIGREYIGAKLGDTLKAGHKYLASMYANRSNEWNYSIATIGMLFTDTAIVLPNPDQGALINANPQIKNTTPLTDTANWVLIQDTITAVGNEAYLTIGNFNTTATSDTVKSNGGWSAYGSAYYLIDGVSVYDLGIAGIEQVINNNEIINIYPSPANTVLNLNLTCSLQLYNVLGSIVKTQTIKNTNEVVDVSLIANGVYFVVVTNGQQVLSTQKIVVQH